MSSLPGRHDRRQVDFSRLSPLVRILLRWPVSVMATLGVLCWTSGCVVPVGPEFQDPKEKVPVPDLPPSFGAQMPPFESSVTLDTALGKRFEFDVEEPNGDQVYVRFVLNYPPYVSGATRLYQTQTSPPYTFTITLSCADVDKYKIADRNLVVIVTDKGFAANPDFLPDADNRYTYEADGMTKAPTMAGWRLGGCL